MNNNRRPISQRLVLLQNLNQNMLVGNRVPKDYFIARGKGESDITVHAGSYHLALRDAGIEMCNIMTYSSILPRVATEINKPEKLEHGSVMETIMAVANSEKGTRATAGIVYGWLYDKKTSEKYGGIVCEYNGNLTETEAKEHLKASLQELYTNGYSNDYYLKEISMTTQSFIPNKRFGTAIVSLCFVNYLYPLIKSI